MSNVQPLHFKYPETSIYWLLGVILVPLIIRKVLNRYPRLSALPPGPAGFPIFGNAFQVPVKMPWFKFTKWAEEFGPIFSLNMAGHPIIVVNMFKAAHDLVDRRSDIYSDRPRFIISGEIFKLRKLRRASHEGLNSRAIEKYQHILTREVALATFQTLNSPDAWVSHINRACASVILSTVYGWPPLIDKDGPLVEEIHAMGAKITEGVVPGAYLVDIIPALEYLPPWAAKWKREGIKWHQHIMKVLEGFNAEVETKMLKGQSPECFVSDLITTKGRHELTDKEAAWLAGIIFLAGPEALAQTLLYFILAMILYPNVMRKAQAELDDVVGRGRIPTFEDQKKLPYIEAVVRETLRWRPPAPMGVPRNATEDHWYDGYLIPKGATVISNIWDSKIFLDFDDFRPDRFLDGIPEYTRSAGHTSFGFGKRICVGNDFANQMLYMTVVTILWASNIEKALDSGGKPIIPSKHDFVEAGIAVGPAPFPCKFSARFPDALSILKARLAD
ncbi:cytochrome P450 [Gymnopilus junonius]|uniref:Cytochrome P450 n=1 Tax=Gymnopilus junonius TaxID=109634 RepID=A0A9P5TSX0_GYMJU|nr:cytochrome P450 [Gymnopilus junonius]